MHLRYRLLTLTTSFALCLALAGLAAAAKPAPTTESVGTVTNIERIDVVTPNSTAAVCKVGESGVPAIFVDYLFPPDDSYLTLLDPASCSGCPAPVLLLTTAHAFLNFRVNCSISVTVQIVGAVQTAPGCYEPDPNVVICAPTNYTLAPGATGNFDFSMALPTACCIDRPAFLSITVNSLGTCPNTSAGRPRLITSGSCVPCRSWNFYPGFTDELCAVGFPGNPIMNVDADCCSVTPTKPGSWGLVKTLYR